MVVVPMVSSCGGDETAGAGPGTSGDSDGGAHDSSVGSNDARQDDGGSPAGGEGVCDKASCWEHPLPHGMYISNLLPLGSNDVWVVAHSTKLLHFEGKTWSFVEHGQALDQILSLWGTAPNNLWMVMREPWHFDGRTWTQFPGDSEVPATSRGTTVWGTDSNNVWLVGSSVLQRWNGTKWIVAPPPPGSSATNRGLHSISGTGPDNVWIVSEDPPGLFQWTGVNWVEHPFARTVAAFSKTDVWSFGTEVRRYNGTSWQTVPEGRTADRVVGRANDFYGFAHGSNDVAWHYAAGTWTNVDIPKGMPSRTDFAAPPSGPVWVVGEDGLVATVEGNTFTSHHVAETYENLTGILTDRTGVSWAVGDGGTILRREGLRWVRETSGTTANLRAITESETTGLWAVGYDATAKVGVVIHREGGTWKNVTVPIAVSNPNYNAVWAEKSEVLIATGNIIPPAAGASVLRYDGATWTEAYKWSTTSAAAFTGITGNGTGKVWVSGGHKDGGFVVSRESASGPWNVTPMGKFMLDVRALTPTEVWAVGGSLSRYEAYRSVDGGPWSLVFEGQGRQFRQVRGPRSNDVWLTSASVDSPGGEIFHYDGATLNRHTDIGAASLGIAASGSEVRVCGEHGSIVRVW
jgi:hypothetical protein